MAKKNNKSVNSSKSQKTVGTIDIKSPKNKIPTPPVEETIQIAEVVTEEEMTKKITDVTIGQLTTGKSLTGLDANHRVELNGQIIDLFVKNPDAQNKFGSQVCETMTQIAAVGVISAVADEAVNGNSTFALTVKKTAYPALAEAASMMGITLPSMEKLLPGEVKDTVNVESNSIKISTETKKALEEEKKIEDAGDNKQIELNPVKVAHMSEEDLTKALTYLLVTGLKRNKSIKDSLVETVDFMHAYRIELARQAENSTDAMNAYEDRTMYEWLSDIFHYVKPTTHIKGIGIGMHSLIVKEKSPLSAFVVLRQTLTDKETKNPVWDDQSIADTVRAMVEIVCQDRIAAETKSLESLDKKDAKFNELSMKYKYEIQKEKEVLEYLANISFALADKYNENDEDDIAQKAYGRIAKMYYPECENRGGHYRGLNENIQQRIGIILNLFRSPGDKNALYKEENITPVKEIPLDEYNKIMEEVKKTKLAESKKDLPHIIEKDLPVEYLKDLYNHWILSKNSSSAVRRIRISGFTVSN